MAQPVLASTADDPVRAGLAKWRLTRKKTALAN